MKFNIDYQTGGISAKNRQNRRYIGLESINRRKNRACSDARSNEGSLSKYQRYIDDISDISSVYWIYCRYIGYIVDISKKYRDFFESF